MTLQRVRRVGRRAGGIRTGRRRRRIWAFDSINASIPAAGTVSAFQLLEGFETDMGAQLIESTISAMHGRLQVYDAGGAAAGDFYEIVIGIAVVSQNAFDSLAVPDPTSSHYDWMYLTGMRFTARGVAGTQELLEPVRGFEWANRSMRKFPELDSTLVLAVGTEASAGQANFTVFNRTLVLLP